MRAFLAALFLVILGGIVFGAGMAVNYLLSR